MARVMPAVRLALFAVALAGWAATTGAAFAQECGDDLKRMSEKRNTELEKVNNLVRAAKGKPIDPSIFCAQSAGLIAAESAMIAYMEKNKDWCGVPDEALAGMKANHVKSVAFAHKACTVAAQMKKQQAAGAAQAQPLPTGPL
jgi:hypothetical protein